MRFRLSAFAIALALGACTETTPTSVGEQEQGPSTAQFVAQSAHSPPFARVPYVPFTRAEAIAITEQEWRLFGQRVDDNPPHSSDNEPAPADDFGRLPGFWERIGEYWW